MLDKVTWQTECEQSVMFHSSLNLIQELLSIKGKD